MKFHFNVHTVIQQMINNYGSSCITLCTFLIKYTGIIVIPVYYNYKNKNWLQFLFIVKAAVLKQQISKFYPQIQHTEDSDHIYFSQRPFINVKAIFCA